MISLISVMSIFLIGVGFIGCYASHRITGAMNDLYQQNLLAVMQLNAMRAYVRALEITAGGDDDPHAGGGAGQGCYGGDADTGR